METPKPGDLFYDVGWFGNDNGGKLITVTYVKSQILEGASVPTYTMRNASGGRIICSADRYKCRTPQEAWAQYRKDLIATDADLCKQRDDITKSLVEVGEEIQRIDRILEDLCPKNQSTPTTTGS